MMRYCYYLMGFHMYQSWYWKRGWHMNWDCCLMGYCRSLSYWMRILMDFHRRWVQNQEPMDCCKN